MRVLIDMNLTPRWVGYLTQAGHEAIHWSTAGPVLAKDREICEYCRRRGYALLTNDLDFPRFLHIREKRRRASFSCGVNHSCRRAVAPPYCALWKSVRRKLRRAQSSLWIGRTGYVRECSRSDRSC